jgi:PAS domain S-box-containing protein
LNLEPLGIRGRKRRTSIALIVVVVVVGVTLLVLGAAGSLAYKAFRDQERADLAALHLALTEQAAASLALPMWNFDKAQIRKASESLMKVRSIEAVVVHEPSRRRVLALVRDGQGEPSTMDGPIRSEGLLARQQEVLFSGEVVGRVEVWATTRFLEERLETIRASLIVFVVVLAVLLSGALHLVLWSLALHPLRRLEQFSSSIEEGADPASGLSGERFQGELESLRVALVRMVDLLHQRYLDLQQETRRHRSSEERFRILIDTIPDLVWLKDLDGAYLACNKTFERLFGAPESQILGRSDHDFVEPSLAELFRENDRKALASGTTWRNEEWVDFADGSGRVLLDTVKTPMRDPDGNLVGVLGVGRDITSRHQADEERRILDVRMNNMQKLEALGVLVAGVAHNINNVLAAIMGTASLRAEVTSDDADREAHLRIVTACRRGRDVVKSLMQFSRPTLSNQEPVDVHALLTEVRLLLDNTLRNRVRFEEAFHSEPMWIHGDAGSISHSVMNLCINAMDAMPNGGTIRLRTRPVGADRLEILVEDSGEGMTPEVLARVLEPFFTTKEVGKGTGLGLSMTHGVVKAHGGDLEIESVPGRGTTVTIRLPRIGSPGLQELAVPSRLVTTPLSILLVDDDDDIRLLVTRMLRAQGHRVEVVTGGKQAIERLFQGTPPDLVIMDQNMPGMDGVTALSEIRKTHPTLPVLISSGQPDIQEWECFRSPHVALLNKPFDHHELLAKLATFSPPPR